MRRRGTGMPGVRQWRVPAPCGAGCRGCASLGPPPDDRFGAGTWRAGATEPVRSGRLSDHPTAPRGQERTELRGPGIDRLLLRPQARNTASAREPCDDEGPVSPFSGRNRRMTYPCDPRQTNVLLWRDSAFACFRSCDTGPRHLGYRSERDMVNSSRYRCRKTALLPSLGHGARVVSDPVAPPPADPA